MSKFDIFSSEEKYRKISKTVHGVNHGTQQLFNLVVFFEELIAHHDSLFLESYIAESNTLWLTLLEKYSPFGKPVELSERILLIVEKIKYLIKTEIELQKFNSEFRRIQGEVNELLEILNGSKTEDEYSTNIAFPLVENTDEGNNFGVTDSLTILLSPNTKLINDEFSIVPSLPKLDNKIEKQLLNSWKYAKIFLSIENDLKIPKFKVVIEYNKRIGFYTGDSNGIAITLGFIIELAKYQKSRKNYEINDKALFTGLVDIHGVVGEVSNEVIEKKIRIAFYSKYKWIVIPQKDYLHAERILISERKNHPKREISLVPVNNMNEIISNAHIIKVKEIDFWNFHLSKIKNNKFNLVTLFLFAVTFALVLLLSYSISKNSSSVENEDFLEYATAEYGLKKDKLAPIKQMGEIFNLKFDKTELDTQKSSKILNYKNIEFVENRFGEPEKAFSFNGKNSYLELKDKNQLKCELPISISMWSRKLDDDFGWLFTNNFDTTNYHGIFMGFISKNIPSIHFGNGGNLGNLQSRKSVYAKKMIKIGRWNHIVGIIHSSDSLTLFLNSKKMESYYTGEAKEVNYNDGEVYLGKFKNSKIFPVIFYHGEMDDFRFFNRVLTDEEIDVLFHEK